MANDRIGPLPDAPVTNPATLKVSGDPEPLKAISLSALQEHLDRHPTHSAYVNPMATVSSPAANRDFYEAASRYQAQWCTLLNRSFGCGNVRRLRWSSDAATVSLALSGTFLADGQVHLPGCWPIHTPKSSYLKKTPFGSPAVPSEFLDLVDHPLKT